MYYFYNFINKHYFEIFFFFKYVSSWARHNEGRMMYNISLLPPFSRWGSESLNQDQLLTSHKAMEPIFNLKSVSPHSPYLFHPISRAGTDGYWGDTGDRLDASPTVSSKPQPWWQTEPPSGTKSWDTFWAEMTWVWESPLFQAKSACSCVASLSDSHMGVTLYFSIFWK